MNTPITILRVNMCGHGVRGKGRTPFPYKDTQNWLFLGKSGCLKYKDNENDVLLKKDHLYILPAHKTFSLTDVADNDFDHLFIAFDCSHPIGRFYDFEVKDDKFLIEFLELITKYYRSLDTIVLGTMIKAILHYVLPSDDSTGDFANRIKNYIDEHLPAFSIDDVCEHFHYGKRYLDMKFKIAFGISINKYGKNEQFSYVTNQLSLGRDLAGICDDIGYSSPANLSRDFKKHYGSSPSEYKKILIDFIKN